MGDLKARTVPEILRVRMRQLRRMPVPIHAAAAFAAGAVLAFPSAAPVVLAAMYDTGDDINVAALLATVLLLVAAGFVTGAAVPKGWWAAPLGVIGSYSAVFVLEWLVTTPDALWIIAVVTIPFTGFPTACGAGLGAALARGRWRSHPPGSCAACGYSLRGILTDVCPECGTNRRRHRH